MIDWTATYFERHRIRVASAQSSLGIETWNRERALDYLALGIASGGGGGDEGKATVRHVDVAHDPESFKPSAPWLSTLPRAPAQESPEEGDKVTVLEIHRPKYTDLVEVALLSSLVVIKKVPGTGGGLIVQTEKGNRLKVAQSHAVKL